MRVFALARVAAHIVQAAFKLGFRARYWDDQTRAAEIARWARGVFALFGIRLVVRGAPARRGGMLYAGNHVSWLDIYALLAATDLRFVAKAEVRGWPVIGWLAAQVGTQFIVRDRRSDAHSIAATMSDLMRGGISMCIFPEGTTTAGYALRPFRASLFQPAAQGRAPVQPFAIRYLRSDGRLSDAAAFTGDMSLGQSIWMLLGARGLVCELTFLDAIDTASMSRRGLARAVEDAVRAHLGVGVTLVDPANATPTPEADLVTALYGAPLPPAAPYT